MFLQHLFTTHIPQDAPRRGSRGLIIPLAPGQGRQQLHLSHFSAFSTHFYLLQPSACCSTQGLWQAE